MIASPLIQIPARLPVTDEQFQQFAQANPDMRLELNAEGELIAMAPTGSESGNYNAELTGDFVLWNRQTQLGKIFDSSTGFRLANGAIRAPDVAWVTGDRWADLTPEQRQTFAPICPNFVLELASATDTLEDLRAKMQEYLNNGCQLGWLILPKTRTVEIYRPQQAVELRSFAIALSDETVLPGFCLNLETIFPTSD